MKGFDDLPVTDARIITGNLSTKVNRKVVCLQLFDDKFGEAPVLEYAAAQSYREVPVFYAHRQGLIENGTAHHTVEITAALFATQTVVEQGR